MSIDEFYYKKVGEAGELTISFGAAPYAMGIRPGITAQEVADIAMLQIGNAWEYSGCTSLVYAITNLAGSPYYGHNQDTAGKKAWDIPSVFEDPVNRTGSTYFLPRPDIKSHSDWSAEATSYSRDDVWATQINIIGNGTAHHGGSLDVSWTSIAGELRIGDAVRFTTDINARFHNARDGTPHSFIVSRVDEEGNVWVIDNGGGSKDVNGQSFARTVTERPLLGGVGTDSIEYRYGVNGIQEWVHVSRIHQELVALHGGDDSSLLGNATGDWSELEAGHDEFVSTFSAVINNSTVNGDSATNDEFFASVIVGLLSALGLQSVEVIRDTAIHLNETEDGLTVQVENVASTTEAALSGSEVSQATSTAVQAIIAATSSTATTSSDISELSDTPTEAEVLQAQIEAIQERIERLRLEEQIAEVQEQISSLFVEQGQTLTVETTSNGHSLGTVIYENVGGPDGWEERNNVAGDGESTGASGNPTVDLALGGIVLSDYDFNLGERIDVGFEVANFGSGYSAIDYTINFYISGDKAISDDDWLWNSYTERGEDFGSSEEIDYDDWWFRMDWATPEMPVHTFYVIGEVVAHGGIEDGDLGNNVRDVRVTVHDPNAKVSEVTSDPETDVVPVRHFGENNAGLVPLDIGALLTKDFKFEVPFTLNSMSSPNPHSHQQLMALHNFEYFQYIMVWVNAAGDLGFSMNSVTPNYAYINMAVPSSDVPITLDTEHTLGLVRLVDGNDTVIVLELDGHEIARESFAGKVHNFVQPFETIEVGKLGYNPDNGLQNISHGEFGNITYTNESAMGADYQQSNTVLIVEPEPVEVPEAPADLMSLSAAERSVALDLARDFHITLDVNDPTAGILMSAGARGEVAYSFDLTLGANGDAIVGNFKHPENGFAFAASGLDLNDGETNTIELIHDADANRFTIIVDDTIIDTFNVYGDSMDLSGFEHTHVHFGAQEWWWNYDGALHDHLNDGGVIAAEFASYSDPEPTSEIITLKPGAEGIDASVTNIYWREHGQGMGDRETTSIGGWGDWYRSFIKFDLEGVDDHVLENLTRASLRMWKLENTSTTWKHSDVRVNRVEEAWDEDTVGWNNQPGMAEQIAMISKPNEAGQWIEIDVLDFIEGVRDGLFDNHGFSLSAMQNSATSNAYATSDHSDASLRPELVLEWEAVDTEVPLVDSADTVVFASDFDDGVRDIENWTYQNNVSEAGGVLELRMALTDKHSTARIDFDESLTEMQMSFEMFVHAANTYFSGDNSLWLKTATGEDFRIDWANKLMSYGSDGGANFDKPRLGFHNLGGESGVVSFDKIYTDGLRTSEYLDHWTSVSIEFSGTDGTFSIDLDGDEQADLFMQHDQLVGAVVTGHTFGTYGWWTEHYTQIDDLVVTGEAGSFDFV